ncbi:MAG: NAD-dependent epimerase/dehydratase family protein [Flavobacteriales bacterium]|nr:NAD-dependent epimerase/dehydratase family protein [Flavobacteriales bacterium]
MKVVITGANGFVGRALLHRLVNGAAFGGMSAALLPTGPIEPIAVVRSPAAAEALRTTFPTLHIVVSGIKDVVLAEHLAGAHAVVHLAWSTVPVVADADPGGDLEANLAHGLQFLESCGRAHIGRFVFVSSGGTLYGSSGTVPHTERTVPDPRGAYGTGKHCFELYMNVRAKQLGFEALALRVANLYGKTGTGRKEQGVVEQWMDRIWTGSPLEVWNGLDVVRDYVFIDDMIDVLLAAVERPIKEPLLNVGTGIGTSLGELRAHMARIIGRDAVVQLRGDQPPSISWNVLDPSLLQRTWGLAPRTTLDAGLNKLWAERQLRQRA